MVRAASGSQSPVLDMAFNDIFEVIQELEMPNSAQIVPGRDDCPTEFYKMNVDNLREAKIYGSDLNLANIKPEPTEVPCPFTVTSSQISEWMGMSMQLGERTRGKPEPELFLTRDFSSAYQDDVQWGEKLINETKNLFQYLPFNSRDLLPENYRNYAMTDTQESHIVPELEENNWFDTPEELFINNEDIIPKNSEESYLSESYSSDSEPPFDAKKVEENMMIESPDICNGKIETHSPWAGTLPRNPLSLAKKPVATKKEFKRCKSSFKSGRPRLCQFLLELLSNPDKYANLIEWIDKEKGVFKFLNSSRVAQEWGERRNKPRMKYENFARSLRTYIAKGILTKPRSKLVYKFASVS